MPIYVPIHQITREYERFHRRDALVGDRGSLPRRIERDRAQQAVPVDGFAKGHPAIAGISQKIVDFVGIQGAAENMRQAQVGIGDRHAVIAVVDHVSHPKGVRLCLHQGGVDFRGRIQDDLTAAFLVVGEEHLHFFEDVAERVVANVVQQAGRQQNARIFDIDGRWWFRPDKPAKKLSGNMEDAQRVFKPGMARPGIHQKHVAQLGDVTQALEFLGVNKRDHILGNMDVSPDRIPDGFA